MSLMPTLQAGVQALQGAMSGKTSMPAYPFVVESLQEEDSGQVRADLRQIGMPPGVTRTEWTLLSGIPLNWQPNDIVYINADGTIPEEYAPRYERRKPRLTLSGKPIASAMPPEAMREEAT